MTLEEYINNPLGIKIAANMREMYRSKYTSKFDAVLVRENGKLNYKLFKSKDKFYIFIKIPSEVVPDFYYDVVIEFYPSDKGFDSFKSLEKYNIRVFSNDPSFVFTYAHAFKSHDMFIKELSGKMSSEALRKKAKERNPENSIGYVKSIYFAYLYMQSHGLFAKIKYNLAEKIDFKSLMKEIDDADKKISDRQSEAEKLNPKKKEQERKERRLIGGGFSNTQDSTHNLFTRTTNRVSSIKKVNSVKRTRYSNSLKRK